MSHLRDLSRNWDELAEQDALWAVLAEEGKDGKRWDAASFFATGRDEISGILGRLEMLGRSVDARGAALDFGCGVGRLTQALAERFAQVDGVDVSPQMIEQARLLNGESGRCAFHVNDSPDLRYFAGGSFAFVYSNWTLQHMRSGLARLYIAELVRVVGSEGTVVFQVPDSVGGPLFTLVKIGWAVRMAVRPRDRARRLLGWVRGAPASAQPQMEMHALAERRVRQTVTRAGGRILDVHPADAPLGTFWGWTRKLLQSRGWGYLPKYYVVVRD